MSMATSSLSLCVLAGLTGRGGLTVSGTTHHPIPPPPKRFSAVATSGLCSIQGSAEHFAPLLLRLSLGQPINVLAIGSSITGVHGGCTAAAPVLATGRCVKMCPLCCGSKCGNWGNRGWARDTFNWLNASFPVSDLFGGGWGHTLYNLGEPGGNLVPAISACPRTFIDFDVHLVLLDLLNSHIGQSGHEFQAAERLVRTLLVMRSQPAVVLVEFGRMYVGRARGSSRLPAQLANVLLALRRQERIDPMAVQTGAAAANASSRLAHTVPPPGRTSSGAQPSLPAAKGVPSRASSASVDPEDVELAQRLIDDVFQGVAPSATPAAMSGADVTRQELGEIKWLAVNAKALRRLREKYALTLLSTPRCLAVPLSTRLAPLTLSQFSRDGLHPTPAGSTLIGQALITLVQRMLERASSAKAASPGSALPVAAWNASLVASRLPDPLTAQPHVQGIACYTFDLEGYKKATDAVGKSSLAGSNGEGLTTGTLAHILPTSRGWHFIEREPKSSTPAKPGLVSELAGSMLEIGIGIAGVANPSVVLQYLRSYEGLGIASFSCQASCSCEPTEIDGHRPTQHTSTLETMRISLRLVGSNLVDKSTPRETSVLKPRGKPGDESTCVLRLLIQNRTSSEGYRFKIARLILEGSVRE